MGIYGALSTAVTGLRAQAFSLENISGNIANSQTTGFKRIDTDFVDLIPDAPQKRQTAGSVLAQSRSTNNVQGDIKGASTDTFMAINGNGFFVVEPRHRGRRMVPRCFPARTTTRAAAISSSTSRATSSTAPGYYLKGLPIDPVTQNISGSVPQVLQISNQFLPAQQTTASTTSSTCRSCPRPPNTRRRRRRAANCSMRDDFVSITPEPAGDSHRRSTVGTGATPSVPSLSPATRCPITVGGTTRTYAFTVVGNTMPADRRPPQIDTSATTTVGHLITSSTASSPNAPRSRVNGDGRFTVTAGNAGRQHQIVTDDTTGTGHRPSGWPNRHLRADGFRRAAALHPRPPLRRRTR
jgi:flagellar hook protein FlgE